MSQGLKRTVGTIQLFNTFPNVLGLEKNCRFFGKQRQRHDGRTGGPPQHHDVHRLSGRDSRLSAKQIVQTE